jgi:CheY-like chemotaxis protein
VRRVLVVDDEIDILDTLRDTLPVLSDRALDIEVASSGEAARDRILAGERFDLVISDERMPGMKGTELLRIVRDHAPDSTRILMTAYNAPEVIQRAQEIADVDHVVLKPFEAEDLAEVLRLHPRGPPLR